MDNPEKLSTFVGIGLVFSVHWVIVFRFLNIQTNS